MALLEPSLWSYNPKGFVAELTIDLDLEKFVAAQDSNKIPPKLQNLQKLASFNKSQELDVQNGTSGRVLHPINPLVTYDVWLNMNKNDAQEWMEAAMTFLTESSLRKSGVNDVVVAMNPYAGISGGAARAYSYSVLPYFE